MNALRWVIGTCGIAVICSGEPGVLLGTRRGAPLIGIGTEGGETLAGHTEDVIYVPDSPKFLFPLLAAIPLQLLILSILFILSVHLDNPFLIQAGHEIRCREVRELLQDGVGFTSRREITPPAARHSIDRRLLPPYPRRS